MKPSKPRTSSKPAMPTMQLDAHDLSQVVGADIYLQYPRGSNNRPGG